MSHSRSTSLQHRRRPQTPSLFLLFGSKPIKSPSPPPISSPTVIDFTIRSKSTIRKRRSHVYSLQSHLSLPTIASNVAVEDQPTYLPLETTMPFGASQQFPPTPTPSVHTSSQRNSRYQGEEDIMFANAEAGPSSGLAHSLPPTPPINEELEQRAFELNSSSIVFQEPTITQRPRRGRRPASVYPPAEQAVYQSHRKYTDPTPHVRDLRLEDSPALDVDLDAYSADFDGEEREPTLSFVTSSTADSTTATPLSINGAFDYKSEFGKRIEGEPRIRLRSTAGRTNAYSSAESSLASGAYSYHAYADNHVYHPHPPPLPSVPTSYAQNAESVGLGFSSRDSNMPENHSQSQAVHSPSAGVSISPTNSISHRPWKRDVINRLRSDSASSSITTASMSTSESHVSMAAGSISSQPYPFAGYAHNLPWERDDMEHVTPEAVALVDEGKERIFNANKLEEMGGVAGLTEDTIDGLRGKWFASFCRHKLMLGTTHLLLPNVGSGINSVLSILLSVLAPSLVVLDLSSNYLSFLPESLQNCTSLEELNLSENPIRVLPGWVGELTGLRMLVVDGCGLQSLPSEIAALHSLHTICGMSSA